MTTSLEGLEIVKVALCTVGLNPDSQIMLYKSADAGKSDRNQLANDALALMAAEPRISFAEAASRVALDHDTPVEKQGDPTLAEWTGHRLAQLARDAVSKGDSGYADAVAKVAADHPGLMDLRYCGVAHLPIAEAVTRLTKALADETDQHDHAVMTAMIAELR